MAVHANEAGALRRDTAVMSLVGVAHFSSHFYQLVLPPLFLSLIAAFGVGYTELGLVMTLFYGASGLFQTPAGFLVDRFGARRVLLGGMATLAAATALMGLAPGFWWLLPLAVLAGLGNSVYHPADLSILTAQIDGRRIGRAYGVHAFAGNIGWAAAPVAVVTLAAWFDWRVALTTVGLAGLAVTAVLALQGDLLESRGRTAMPQPQPAGPAPAPGGGLRASIAMLTMPVVLMCFLYFAFLAMALIGVQTQSVGAMLGIYALPHETATAALTAFLVATAVGVIFGGVLADRTDRHDLVAMGAMALAGAAMLAIASGWLATWPLLAVFVFAGFVGGSATPSRDMLVRAATPKGASGRIFGFVYSGLDLGSAVTPLLFGVLLDLQHPNAVFLGIGALFLAAIPTVMQVRRRTPAGAAA